MDVTALNNSVSNAQTTAQKNAQETQDRFLKLLVAQMKNQDPMNPMDNAQVTSQMAQIQTVSGISTLDGSVKTLAAQFSQMQALQSVSLVGRDVSVPGNKLAIEGGKAVGAYELDSAADTVKLEVLSAAGGVIDTVQLGAQGAGRQSFSVDAAKYGTSNSLSFRITANKGTAVVPSTAYMVDKVVAVNTTGNELRLELAKLGLVEYSKVATID